MASARGEVSFKRSAHRWFLVACIGGFGLIGLVDIPASAYEGGYYASDSAFVIASRTFSALVAIGSLFFGIRVARMGVFADETGLTVRNVLRTQRALWGEIAGFGPPGAYGSLRRTGLKIVLRDRAGDLRHALQPRSAQPTRLRRRHARPAGGPTHAVRRPLSLISRASARCSTANSIAFLVGA